MKHGATAAAAAYFAIALFSSQCAASSLPLTADPSGAGAPDHFDHVPLTAGAAAATPWPVATPAAAAAAAPSTAPPPVSAAPLPAWDVRTSDGTIRGVLTRWSRSAGWQLVWDAPVDFSIDAQATLRGSFEDVLQALVASLGRTATPIQAILYRGNHVLRVVAQGAG
jgi:hypothetical protein